MYLICSISFFEYVFCFFNYCHKNINFPVLTTSLIASQDFSCPLISSVFPLMTLLNVASSVVATFLRIKCVLLALLIIIILRKLLHCIDHEEFHTSLVHRHSTPRSSIHPFIDTQSLMNENHKQPQLGFNYYVEELFLTVCRHPLVDVLLLQLQSLFYSPDPQQLAAQPRPAQLSSPVQASHP